MHPFAKLVLVTLVTLATYNTGTSAQTAQQVQYGVSYTDSGCHAGEDRIYGTENYIRVDLSHIVRGLKGFRPLTIYSDAKCTQNAKYYLANHCASYNSQIVSIFCPYSLKELWLTDVVM